jgi:hypothetical protein
VGGTNGWHLVREKSSEVSEGFPEVLHLDLGVDLSGLEIAVAHQVRDVGQRHSGHPKVGAEGVTEGVNGGRPRAILALRQMDFTFSKRCVSGPPVRVAMTHRSLLRFLYCSVKTERRGL